MRRRDAQLPYLPFAAMSLVAFLLALAPGGHALDWTEYAVAALVVAGAVAVRAWELANRRVPGLFASAIYLIAIGLLRDSAGGMLSGLGILVLLPVIWHALHSTRRSMYATLVMVAITLVVPQVMIGAPSYPATGFRSLVLTLCLGLVLGVAIEQLVGRLRGTAERLRAREQEQTMLLRRVEKLAGTDSLTGIPNRRSWEERMTYVLEREDTAARGLCVALLDIDHFKALNDAAGHAAGDHALRECTAAWAGAMRPGDSLARLGGDEFAVALLDCDIADAETIVERLRTLTPVTVTVSAGVAEYRPGDTYDELLARADRALYAAKVSGRDRVLADSMA